MRLLYSRDDLRGSSAARLRAEPNRGAGTPSPARQPVPLHRLSKYRRRRAFGGKAPTNRSPARCGSPLNTPANAPAAHSEHANFVGQPVLRREDARMLTGRGRFTDDIQLPGMTYAAVLRSSYGHARIRPMH